VQCMRARTQALPRWVACGAATPVLRSGDPFAGGVGWHQSGRNRWPHQQGIPSPGCGCCAGRWLGSAPLWKPSLLPAGRAGAALDRVLCTVHTERQLQGAPCFWLRQPRVSGEVVLVASCLLMRGAAASKPTRRGKAAAAHRTPMACAVCRARCPGRPVVGRQVALGVPAPPRRPASLLIWTSSAAARGQRRAPLVGTQVGTRGDQGGHRSILDHRSRDPFRCAAQHSWAPSWRPSAGVGGARTRIGDGVDGRKRVPVDLNTTEW
jgi:hypothetical protein